MSIAIKRGHADADGHEKLRNVLFQKAIGSYLAKMIADASLVDLDDLAHRLLVTHRLLLHFRRKPSNLKVRKISRVIEIRAIKTAFTSKT